MSDQHRPGPSPYSLAFESFVGASDDIVGLLAYALYKQDIREARVQGLEPTPSSQRRPGNTEVKAFRSFAERSIEEVVAHAIEAERLPWIEAGREEGRIADKREIVDVIRGRTSYGAAVATGIVAWLLSIVITVLVVYAAPGWVRHLADRVGGATAASPPASDHR